MSSLTKAQTLTALTKLGEFMANPDPTFQQVIQTAHQTNAWFTANEIYKALKSLSNMLKSNDLQHWLAPIHLSPSPKRIGLILAGNIPLVGFHDVLCVIATGNIALIKMSAADDKLLPALLSQLIRIEPQFANQISYVDRLVNFDAVIATGSNNSSRYFEYYFGNVPHIIRKNRVSVAVLNGSETTADIENLGRDIFDYFGLGCRNVSKIYIPKNYEIKSLFEPLEKYQAIIDHFKYNNNYDYNKSVYLINGVRHFDNGFLLVKEDENFVSPLAVLFFEEYENIAQVEEKLSLHQSAIQCMVSNLSLGGERESIAFGQSQSPKLWDYADDVNTIDFLHSLSS